MNQNKLTPKYATLLYEVLQVLDISITEYFYLDMVYHLSHDGWCYKSLDSIAHDMKMERTGIMKLRNRLISKGLILKNAKGHVKTSVIYDKVIRNDNQTYDKVTKAYDKVNSAGGKSQHKNNNRITLDLEKAKNSTDNRKTQADNRGTPSPAKERIRAMLKQKAFL